MGGIVDKVVEVGTLGLVKDASGTKAAGKAARDAAGRQQATLAEGQRMGRADLNDNFQQQMDYLQGGRDDAAGYLQTGNRQATNYLNQGFGGAMSQLRRGQASAEAPLQGYSDIGGQAAQLEAAMSGALGPEAQAQAMSNYQESPEIAYMREMGEKSAMRGFASQGRSLSGSALEELNRRGTGLAMQDFGNRMGRLSSLAARGQQAGGALANMRTGLNTNLANMQLNRGQALAGQADQYGNNRANLYNSTAQNMANAQNQLGVNLSNISTNSAAQQSNIQGQLGQAQANAALARGQFGMDVLGTIGGALTGMPVK
jgi:hypothetical protein